MLSPCDIHISFGRNAIACLEPSIFWVPTVARHDCAAPGETLAASSNPIIAGPARQNCSLMAFILSPLSSFLIRLATAFRGTSATSPSQSLSSQTTTLEIIGDGAYIRQG